MRERCIDEVAKVLGFKVAKLLVEEFGGELIYVPRFYPSRKDSIVKDLDDGKAIPEVALEHSITVRRVQQIAREIYLERTEKNHLRHQEEKIN